VRSMAIGRRKAAPESIKVECPECPLIRPAETFDFLGYTFGRCYSQKTGRAYLGTRPSKRKVQKICREISEVTQRRMTLLEPEIVVRRLNAMLVGWANYFRLGPVGVAYRAIDEHAARRLRQWLCRKHGVQAEKYPRFPDQPTPRTGADPARVAYA
jgi:RNA-directed DNA polymerase